MQYVKGIDLSEGEIEEARSRCGACSRGQGVRASVGWHWAQEPEVRSIAMLARRKAHACWGCSRVQSCMRQEQTRPPSACSPAPTGPALCRLNEALQAREGVQLVADFVATPDLGIREWREEEQFDAVTCMFAIHYFFVSEKALKQVRQV